MKKMIMMLALAATVIACETSAPKASAASELKTAYIDTEKMMEECVEVKDITEKYKSKGEAMGRQFEVAEANFNAEAASFEKNARANGQAWAEQKGAELSRRQQQLEMSARRASQELQMQHATEIDSVKKDIRDIIKNYGKEKGYDYIFGTGDAPSVLYAKDGYDVTKDIVKIINDKYAARKEDKPEAKKEEKK